MGYVTALQKKLSDYTDSLHKVGFLDDRFKKLLDKSKPDFVVEVIHTYFKNTERLMSELAKTLSPESEDFEKMDFYLHQLDGISSCIGAQRVHEAVITFRNYCREKNIDRCLTCLQELENEYSLVKEKLETMIELEKQILAAAGSLPPPDMEKQTKKE